MMNKPDDTYPVKVFVVSSETLFSEGIIAIINSSEVLVATGSSTKAADAIEKTTIYKPDILLVDTSMPAEEYEYLIQTICRYLKDVKILLVGIDKNKEPILNALSYGAKGYISRTASASALISAINDVSRGVFVISSSMTNNLVAEYCTIKAGEMKDKYYTLSGREKEILRYIASGYTSRTIANKLNITVKTAMSHRARLRHKLGINSTAELTKLAVMKHLVDLHN